MIELVSFLACLLQPLLVPSLALGHALSVKMIVDRISAVPRRAI